jgi:hypothetical protein
MSIAFGPGISCGRPNLLECGLPEFGPVAIQAVPGQTGDQLRILDTSSNVVGGFDLNGNLLGASASPAGSVILAPTASARNVIQGTTDGVIPLTVKGHSLTQTADLWSCRKSDNTQFTRVHSDGRLEVTADVAAPWSFLANDPVNPGFTAFIVLPSGGGMQCQVLANNDADVPLTVNGNGNTQTASLLKLNKFGASTVFEVGPNGELGAFGTAAAAQQPTASAAGIAGIRTDTLAHAVADITVILTALRAWGVTFGLTANTA